MIILFLILLTVFLNSCAQILLKNGMHNIGYFTFTWQNFLPIGRQIFLNPYVLVGISIYAISVVVWLLVLSRAEVSYAYPLSTSLAFIATALAGYYLFGEHLTLMRIAGIAIIIVGVYVLNRS